MARCCRRTGHLDPRGKCLALSADVLSVLSGQNLLPKRSRRNAAGIAEKTSCGEKIVPLWYAGGLITQRIYKLADFVALAFKLLG